MFRNVFAVKPLKILGQFIELKTQSSLYHEAILCYVLTYQSLGRLWGSLAVEDHLWSILRIICDLYCTEHLLSEKLLAVC